MTRLEMAIFEGSTRSRLDSNFKRLDSKGVFFDSARLENFEFFFHPDEESY